VSPLHFTGKERDTESNLDDFDARYYSSQFGRFMTPDWDVKAAAVRYAKFGDPLTLNLYTYVENAPLNRIDADGHVANNSASPQWVNPCTFDASMMCEGIFPDPGSPEYDLAQEEANYSQMVADTTTFYASQSAQYTTVPYNVDGGSALAAMNAANASSASGCPTSSAGCTRVEYSYTYDEKGSVQGAGQQYSASLTATNVNVTVSVSVHLPNWTGYKDAPASEQKAWDGMVSKLRDHEEGHVAIARAGAGEIKKAIQGTSAKGSGQSRKLAVTRAGANLGLSVKTKFNAALAAIQQRQNAYDSQP